MAYMHLHHQNIHQLKQKVSEQSYNENIWKDNEHRDSWLDSKMNLYDYINMTNGSNQKDLKYGVVVNEAEFFHMAFKTQ